MESLAHSNDANKVKIAALGRIETQ